MTDFYMYSSGSIGCLPDNMGYAANKREARAALAETFQVHHNHPKLREAAKDGFAQLTERQRRTWGAEVVRIEPMVFAEVESEAVDEVCDILGITREEFERRVSE